MAHLYPHVLHPGSTTDNTEEKHLPTTNPNLGSWLTRVVAGGGCRRPRGEKKPIPDELKDEKYYERRKRNNVAAKKSRDARKMREDQIALRTSHLEAENALLRTQLATLAEEANSLRKILIQKRQLKSLT